MKRAGPIRWRVRPRLWALLLLAPCAFAVIIDRIAVSVGNRVITETDLTREIRVTAFLNGVKPDFSPTAKRATADRMVEQQLFRNELENSRYPMPSAAEVEPVLEKFRREHFRNQEEYRRALADCGIGEQDVKDALLWERTLLRIIEVRFRPVVQVSNSDIEDYFEKVVRPAAVAAHPGQPVSLEDYRDQIDKTLTGKRQDDQMDTWLKGARRRTGVIFHEEVFR